MALNWRLGPDPKVRELRGSVYDNPTPIDVVCCYCSGLMQPNRSTDIADRLRGKVALVVGAGSIGPGWGNGKATAVAFAREGAQVLCADINLTAAEETVGIIKGESVADTK